MQIMMYDLQSREIPFEEWHEKYGFGSKRLRVGRSNFTVKGHRIWIATDLLGLDLGHYEDEPPLIFETMIFVRTKDKHLQPLPYPLDYATFRYATYKEALAGHKTACRVVRKIRAWRVKPALIHKGKKP